MEKYKGYILRYESGQTEDRSWDGHKNSGNGNYVSYSLWEVFNPKTKKSEYFGSKEKALETIDNVKVNKAHNKKIQKVLKAIQGKKDKLDKAIKITNTEYNKNYSALHEAYEALREELRTVI